MTAPRLLRDLIDIPTSVHKGDLVYQLADAGDDAARTVAQYVVTDQLLTAFLEAVKLLRAAVEDGSSMGAFLHGSFGSGKSNFMGVLQLLLDGDLAARGVRELAPVVVELDAWKGDRRFLTVPFHLVGESDLESAVFGQYVRHMERTHPGAAPPAVFADEPILTNADGLRAKVGDDTFFAQLSDDGGAGDDGWGDLGAAWTAATYDAARTAPHGSPDRIRMVQAVLTTWLTGYAEAAQANKGGYVGFEDGLAAISTHAHSLGYGGVILFLDELILWFLSRLADTAWVSEEGSKLSKLVEAPTALRPVPIVSIIARQRDLRELVGDSIPGAEKLSLADIFAHQADRFDTIALDDSNLPVVANRRLLTPIDDAAKHELQAAFGSLSLSPRGRDALLADHGDDASFALTYPFSPAFMTVLVDVAGALQRTRTGLRVLLDLLVARRDELEVGHLVPVGDLYDVIASGDEPFSDVMRSAFDQARRIYSERLGPALRAEHGLGPTDDPTTPFTNDDRLVKTLLLAALVSDSVPFKDLTVERLVALNHGTISSPIPGQETQIATGKLKRLAAQAGELRIGSDPHNPTVSVVLTGVDTASILATADGADNTASRRTLVRNMVSGALGLPPGQVHTTYPMVWKGLRRDVTVTFANLRDTSELPDAMFAHDGPGWKLLVDFPFDEPGHSPLEDIERLDRFREGGASWSTLCWVPSFFTAPTLDILGRLVRLDHVLANDDRFAEATASLSPVARASAKPQLQAMQTAARNQIEVALLGAYGVIGADEGVIDRSHALADHFPSLRAGLTIAPPTRPTLRDALDQVLDQALRHSYPGAPDLADEVRSVEVRRVAELCADAVVEPDGRLVVNDSKDRRLLARIANPLQLGVQSEQAFKLQSAAERWDTTFIRAVNQARSGGASATVGVLRQAINTPEATGLSAPLENLIILVWAQATNHTFRQHGGPATASVERLGDDWEVVDQPLPPEPVWREACDRLATVFGVTLPTRQCSGFAVERAGIELRRLSTDLGPATAGLVERLRHRAGDLGLAPGDVDRLRTAEGAARLFAALDAAPGDLGRVVALADADVVPSPLALGRSIASAADTAQRLDAAQWTIITPALSRPDGAALRDELVTAFEADELVTALGPVLQRVQDGAVDLLSGDPPPPPPPGPPVGTREWTGRSLTDARAKLDELQARAADGVIDGDAVSVTISWSDRDPPADDAAG